MANISDGRVPVATLDSNTESSLWPATTPPLLERRMVGPSESSKAADISRQTLGPTVRFFEVRGSPLRRRIFGLPDTFHPQKTSHYLDKLGIIGRYLSRMLDSLRLTL